LRIRFARPKAGDPCLHQAWEQHSGIGVSAFDDILHSIAIQYFEHRLKMWKHKFPIHSWRDQWAVVSSDGSLKIAASILTSLRIRSVNRAANSPCIASSSCIKPGSSITAPSPGRTFPNHPHPKKGRNPGVRATSVRVPISPGTQAINPSLRKAGRVVRVEHLLQTVQTSPCSRPFG